MSGDGSNSPSLITSTSPASAANGVFLSEGAAGKVNFLTGKLASSYFKLTKIKASVAEYAAQAYDATNAIIAALVKTEDSGHGFDRTAQADRDEPAQGELQGHHGNHRLRGRW